MSDQERQRLYEDKVRAQNWRRWGPYLSGRQWGTVREDYSHNGDSWSYFTHDQSRSRAYRWGEDGLLGITDVQCRLCLGLALWNTRDPILKERLFGLDRHQGNHGEDVKELYYYLDNTPTHSYMKALYKYPQAEFPYTALVEESARRGPTDPEYKILDTGIFNESRYFDVTAEYCKNSPNDILGRFTVVNRGPERATVHVLPQLWYRNVWDWGEDCEANVDVKPILLLDKSGKIRCEHPTLGALDERSRLNSMDRYVEESEGGSGGDGGAHTLNSQTNVVSHDDEDSFFLEFGPAPDGAPVPVLFTENTTNAERLYGASNRARFVKDAFHEYVVNGLQEKVNPKSYGTKCAGHYVLDLAPGQEIVVKLRLYQGCERPQGPAFTEQFDSVFRQRIQEADIFYKEVIVSPNEAERLIARQAYAGLLWNKQFFYYIVREWLRGDSNQPQPPTERHSGRNSDWQHIINKDIVSVPDKWEYPFYSAWNLAFHMIPMSRVDIQFAKSQLVLLLSEWYMNATGQIPAYENRFADNTPPVHAYAVLKVYKASGVKGKRDDLFLARCFHKLVLNFTWWINEKDCLGQNVINGGHLGLDNIGVFDRSMCKYTGDRLSTATPWMGFFCSLMLEISLILAAREPVYQDMASKFFEDFIAVLDSINDMDGIGLWDEEDGFYYAHIKDAKTCEPVKIRSMAGLIPLFTTLVLKERDFRENPGFGKRTKWFIEHRKDLSKKASFMCRGSARDSVLLSITNKKKLVRILRHVLDEDKFLSPFGLRSLSKEYEKEPYVLTADGIKYSVKYEPGESESKLFGGNSNWRGPVHLPTNYLLIENLRRFDYFFGEELMVEFPTGSGSYARLAAVARDLERRITSLFLPNDTSGGRPCYEPHEIYNNDPNFRNLFLFHEFYDGDTGRGCGASHHTGWTALIANILENQEEHR
ncbi:uncharacterized protein LOC127838507 [Dreissena polymorpha]|uniref:Mannosylglycerate hydrolase MGH1-like glycoside hydrolase domain-containing protein n=1 Tax=Dreissena polymorpha TaxID=45954 RepID=A0A9D4MVV2_DREPO|nr:uncharacterized protein LOC127838507 [Dreissena polymorpha]KAH3884842.1 hypothetical protein DPMN_008827 [Dreissena polymorpha]